MRRLKDQISGVLILALATTLFVAGLSHLVGDVAGQYISTQLRSLDSVRPHLIPVAILLSGLTALLGYWRLSLGAGGVSGIIAISLIMDYQNRSDPGAGDPALRVLWFNMQTSNPVAPAALVNALRQTNADIIVLAESRPAIGLPALMSDTHPHRLGCETRETCGLLLLSRHPLKQPRIRQLTTRTERFLRARVDLPGRDAKLHLIATHLIKPWVYGFSEREEQTLHWAIANADNPAPTILMGDFNAAPWSRRMRDITGRFKFRHAKRPVATWPVQAGPWGVPIDHILVRGEAAIASLIPWGSELGSNHLGLIADIALAPQTSKAP
ncbi:MAG: endonuclease/exonuclease/phosphatase family protein [Pseudomonadota bacterium]